MSVCRFCDQRNPEGRTHCAGCGAELPQEAKTVAEAASAPTALRDHAELVETLRDKGKIAAIKQYRDLTGGSLSEAKAAVEAMSREAGLPGPSSTGCATLVMAIVATGCLAGTCVLVGAGRWPW